MSRPKKYKGVGSRISVYLTVDNQERLTSLAKEQNLSVSEFMNKLIESCYQKSRVEITEDTIKEEANKVLHNT